jgi:hypothetical protein
MLLRVIVCNSLQFGALFAFTSPVPGTQTGQPEREDTTMNTITMRMMIGAAALMIAVGSASAQSYKAKVPVAFRIGNKTMVPGSYDIRLTRGAVGQMVVVYNRDTNTSAALVAGVKADPPRDWREAGDPKIAFECTNGACRLSKLWDGSDTAAYQFPAPKAAGTNLASARTEIVTLTMIKAR